MSLEQSIAIDSIWTAMGYSLRVVRKMRDGRVVCERVSGGPVGTEIVVTPEQLTTAYALAVTDDTAIVGYHVGEGVSMFNHHLMACRACAPEHVKYPDQAVGRDEAEREGYVCDECDEPLGHRSTEG